MISMPLYNGVDDNVHDNMAVVRGGDDIDPIEPQKRRKKQNEKETHGDNGREVESAESNI